MTTLSERPEGPSGSPGPEGTESGTALPQIDKKAIHKQATGLMSRHSMFAAWAFAVFVLVIYPMVLLFRLSFREPAGSYGLQNWTDFFGDPSLLRAAWNSLWTATASTIGCVLIAVPLAFLVSRTDLPFRRLLRYTSVLTFAIPNFIVVLGWMLLLGPRSGLLNVPLQSIFGIEEGPINIFSAWGVVFAIVVHVYPLIFLPTAAALDNLDEPLEQAASSLGASRWTVLRTVTLPLIMPAVLGGSILVFTVSFIALGPALLLGGPGGFENISTAMLSLLRFPSRLEMAAVMGVPTLFVLGGLLYIERRYLGDRGFSILSGKPGRHTPLRLGKWRWPAAFAGLTAFTVTLVLPFGILLITSMRKSLGLPLGPDNFTFGSNYVRVLEQPRVVDAFRNSTFLSLASTILAIALAFLAAWLVERVRSRSSGIIAPIMVAPLAFPGAILGIALIIAYAPAPFSLSGSLWILLIAYTISSLPLAFIYQRAGLKQIDKSLEEAARNLGATWIRTARSITLPLLRGPVSAVAVLIFIVHFRDLDSSIFLFNGNNPILAVVVLNLVESSFFQQIGALSIMILGVNILVIGVAFIFHRVKARPTD